jgi:hypothetical protein
MFRNVRPGGAGIETVVNPNSVRATSFPSPDEPFAGQDEEDPQTWNLYSYTSGNPLSRVDEDGRRWFLQMRQDWM